MTGREENGHTTTGHRRGHVGAGTVAARPDREHRAGDSAAFTVS